QRQEESRPVDCARRAVADVLRARRFRQRIQRDERSRGRCPGWTETAAASLRQAPGSKRGHQQVGPLNRTLVIPNRRQPERNLFRVIAQQIPRAFPPAKAFGMTKKFAACRASDGLLSSAAWVRPGQQSL